MMTKREFFEEVATMNPTAEMSEFIAHQLDLLDKAKARDRKPTKTQLENIAIKDTIYGTLSSKPITINEIIATGEGLGTLTNQKVSALLSQLVKENRVVKSYDKRKAMFARK